MLEAMNFSPCSLRDAAVPSQLNSPTDMHISHSLSELSEPKSDLIHALLQALILEPDTKVPHTKPLLEQVEAIFHQYPGDLKADFDIPTTPSIPLIQISQPTPKDDIDVTAFKAELNSDQAVLDKQLTKLAAWSRDEALRSNANYNSALPKVRAADENKTGLDDSPWGSIEGSINNIKENYLAFFSYLMSEYTDMYRAFNDAMQAAASKALGDGSGGKDGNTVNFNNATMNAGYKEFNEYINKHPLKSIPGWSQMSEAQQLAMAENLAPAFKIKVDENEKPTGEVEFDLSQFRNLEKENSVPDKSKNEVPVYKYQAWLSYFNAVGSAFQNGMNSFAQRYKQANDTANNLYKILSGSVNTWGEILKGIIQSWR